MTIATSTYTAMAILTCVLTAFCEVPKKALMRRCCLIHLKNNSTCQRRRYNWVIARAGKSKLLVIHARMFKSVTPINGPLAYVLQLLTNSSAPNPRTVLIGNMQGESGKGLLTHI